MATLALAGRDLFILGAMFVVSVAGVGGAVLARLWFAKVGFVLSAVAVCLGLVNFGWLPLFGGFHSKDVYFGSAMLFVGALSATVVAAIEECLRRATGDDDVVRRGFPVEVNADA